MFFRSCNFFFSETDKFFPRKKEGCLFFSSFTDLGKEKNLRIVKTCVMLPGRSGFRMMKERFF